MFSLLVQDFTAKAKIKREALAKTTRYGFVALINGIKKVNGKIGENGLPVQKRVEVGKNLGPENVMQRTRKCYALVLI